MDNSFLQDGQGNQSNSRLIADIMIVCGLLMALIFIVIGVFKPEIDLMKIATAIGVLYGSVAGTAMTFLFFQKKTEVQEEKNKPDENNNENKLESKQEK
jgi:tetrahydromethanopterin S-methyltransferase subunit G